MTVQVEILSPQDRALVNNTFTISVRAKCSLGDRIESIGYAVGSCHSAGEIVRTEFAYGWAHFSVPLSWTGPIRQGAKPYRDFVLWATCSKGHVGTTHRVFQTEVV